MTNFDDVRKKWMKDPEFVKEYEALEEEFSLASSMIAARAHANMTQQDVAEKTETSQSYIAKLEGGAVSPTMAAGEFPAVMQDLMESLTAATRPNQR